MPKKNDLPTPVTYSQKFYAKAAGMDVDLPEAITPEQKYLKAIAEGGGVSPDDTYTKAQTDALLGGKVDKETGKVLSTNDFTDAYKAAVDGAAPQSTTYTKSEVDTSQAGQNESITSIQASVDVLRLMMDATVYGFRIDKNNSDPETRVEYLYDAIGMTPARMNYTTGVFDYGSWENAWFVVGNRPVALKFDGTVDYELDPDDYTKKADGTASDVSNSEYEGNFMATMPTVWIRRWEDADYQYYAFSDKQINSSFKAYAHDAGDGFINDTIYLPMFEGAIIDGKLRSIAGVIPRSGTSGSEEQTAAEACGTGWQIWDWAKHELISDLLTLISRSTDSQTAFGKGDTNTYDETDTTTYGMLTTGTSGAGRFYGTNDETHHVKVFHFEDFWGNRSDTLLGLNVLNKQFSYKMVRPYALSPDSSISSGFDVPDSGYQIQNHIGEFGNLPKTTGGSAATYICDLYTGLTTNDNRLAFFGGSCNSRSESGSRCLSQRIVSYSSYKLVGASPCYNAPHSS